MWKQLEAWMRPYMAAVIPRELEQFFDLRSRMSGIDASHVISFFIYKTFCPGGVHEHRHLHRKLLSPKPCFKPRAALMELLKWKETIQRCDEIQHYPPEMN